MDIDLLSKMVKELILDKDKVVLPGLGTFVAEMTPASFSDKGYTINPPYRRLYFRSRVDDDSSLADLYAAANNVGRDVAERIVTEFIAEMKTVLQEKKVVVFPGLGRLRATKENNFFFVADENLDIYPEGLGLSPISLKTHQETREEVSAAVEGLKAIIDELPVHDESQLVDLSDLDDMKPMEHREVEPETVHLQEEAAIPETAVDEGAATARTVEQFSVLKEDRDEHEEAVHAPADADEEPVTPVIAGTVDEDGNASEPSEEETDEGTPEQKGSVVVKAVIIIAVTITVAALLLIAYMLVARLNPGLFDHILYNEEQLEILNHWK